MASQQTKDFKADIKLPLPEDGAAPAALPEYTPLPASPVGSSPAPSDSGLTYAAADAGPEHGEGTCAEGVRIARLLWTGYLALVVPPAIVAVAAVACAGAMLYGTGKVLEGAGRGLAFVPEWVYRRVVVVRGRKLLRGVRERAQSADVDVEGGQIAL